MKKKSFFRTLIFSLFILGITACSSSLSDKSYTDLEAYTNDVRKDVKFISQADFKAIMDKGGVYNLIDCRQLQDYSIECITGAINVPRGMLEFSPQIQNRHIPTYIYSDNEDKTILAANSLKMIKYSSVFVISGNMEKWKEQFPEDIQLEPGGHAVEAAPVEEESGCGG